MTGAKRQAASYFFNRTDNHNTSLSDRQTFRRRMAWCSTTTGFQLQDAQSQPRRFNARRLPFSDRHSMMMRASFSLRDNNYRKRTAKPHRQQILRRRQLRQPPPQLRPTTTTADRITTSRTTLYRYRLPTGKTSQHLHRRNRNLQLRPAEPPAAVPSATRQHRCDTTDYSSRKHYAHRPRPASFYDLNGNVIHPFALEERSRLSFPDTASTTPTSGVGRSTFILTKENVFRTNAIETIDRIRPLLPDPPHRRHLSVLFQRRKSQRLYYQRDSAALCFSPMTGKPKHRSTTSYSVVNVISTQQHLKFQRFGHVESRATDLGTSSTPPTARTSFAGNPGLDPIYTHRLSGQYIRANPAKGHLHGLGRSSQPAQHHHRLAGDRLPGLRHRRRGERSSAKATQCTKPVSLAGLWSLRASVNYGMPVRLRSVPQLPGGGLDGPHQYHQRRTQQAECC